MISIKKAKIILTILLAIVILVALVAIWQWDNLEALYVGMTEDSESLGKKREENDKLITNSLEKLPEISVRDLTPEEKEAFAEGKVSSEQLTLILQGKLTLEEVLAEQNVKDEPTESDPSSTQKETPPEDDNTPEVQQPVDKPKPQEPTQTPVVKPPEEVKDNKPDSPVVNDPEKNYDEQISELVAQMYVLKAEFVSALKSLEKTTLEEYASLTKDQRTAEVKKAMMNHVLDTVTKMEKDCDSRVDAILTQLTKVLKEAKKSLDLVTNIKNAYKNEKTITKAEYVKKYFD